VKGWSAWVLVVFGVFKAALKVAETQKRTTCSAFRNH
jgi:hypothetical protein